MVIGSFVGEYRFLSNFWPALVSLDGEVYLSVEGAYQASKTDDRQIREKIRGCSPALAKRLGRAVKKHGDESISIEGRLAVMRDLVSQKFATEPLRSKLLETGDAELIEGNRWGDRFWGVYGGTGENHLGKILMRVRGELRSAT